jgi:hypothetical protein
MTTKPARDHNRTDPRQPGRALISEPPQSSDPSSKKETPPTLWRQLIKVHPAAELFPMMSDDELVLLGRDIAKHGLREHLVVWTPYLSEDFTYDSSEEYLLDGRNRLEAIERVITDRKECEAKILKALQVHYGYRPGSMGDAIRLFGNDDPYQFTMSLNLRRRQLTRSQ